MKFVGLKNKRLTEFSIFPGYNGIAAGAFKDCYDLKSVTLPNTIEYIEAEAFCGCKSLKEIRLPDRIRSIGKRAFEGCSSLRKVTFPDSVKEIGEGAFKNCHDLESVTLPNTIKYIEAEVFCGCISLKEIQLPDGIRRIGERAFEGCRPLRNVTFPDSVEELGEGAFGHCTSLENVVLPKKLKIIESLLFFDCHSLKKVVISDNVRSIRYAAFGKCNCLEEITIPDSVTDIWKDAFSNCRSLQLADIPNSVVYIGAYAFHDCYNLETVFISSSVDTIKEYSFYNCKKLKNVFLNGTLKCIDSFAFANTAVENLKIPFGIKYIGNCAFKDCCLLENIDIPESVEYIGTEAFSNTKAELEACDFVITNGNLIAYNSDILLDALVNVTIPDSVKLIGSVVFDDLLESITIPDSVKKINPASLLYSGWYKKIHKEFVIVGDGILLHYNYNGDIGMLPYYHNNFSDGPNSEIVIPDGVKRIGAYAFSYILDDIEHSMESIWKLTPEKTYTVQYGSLVIPDSVREISPLAFRFSQFKSINIFGMDFTDEELSAAFKMSGRYYFFKLDTRTDTLTVADEIKLYQLRELRYRQISDALKLSEKKNFSAKISTRLKLAAIVIYYLKNKDQETEEYLRRRFFEVVELLIDKNRGDLLISLIETGKFAVGKRRLDKIKNLAVKKNRPEIVDALNG